MIDSMPISISGQTQRSKPILVMSLGFGFNVGVWGSVFRGLCFGVVILVFRDLFSGFEVSSSWKKLKHG